MAYVREKEHIDYATKEEEIKKTIDTLNERNLAFQILKKTLQKFEEKKITRRITYDLKAAGYTVSYEKDKWSVTLQVWGNGLPYGERLWFTFGSEIMEDFCMEIFLKKEEFLDKKIMKNIEQYEEVLRNLIGLVVEYNVQVDHFNAALKEIEAVEEKFRPFPH